MMADAVRGTAAGARLGVAPGTGACAETPGLRHRHHHHV